MHCERRLYYTFQAFISYFMARTLIVKIIKLQMILFVSMCNACELDHLEAMTYSLGSTGQTLLAKSYEFQTCMGRAFG